ncbi:uncharacterized protein LODBEIA_P37350 [Lodderomyces beijingensis]|uniref:Pescadillo homolog n=1 Tax=Lodderomyces beijingensis TaxID=1775926 RepID=A0ABP0ZRH9_9ASCO
MAKIKKRGASGAAKNFITRTQAIKKLQISLADFRRLCIFKGIYPREPRNKKKANKGSTAPVTFYYSKDIQYLLHEPVLDKFRQHKTFAKKLQRALGKGEIASASKLDANRPKYTLNHIIKERYPTFIDALRDLDDPLNMLFLFSNMPAIDRVSTKIIGDAEKLCNYWLAYVSKERLLKKMFVSIKGVYYQATVKGQEVRWLIPYKFPTNIPTDVDFRIMLTFLEFYSTLLNFVLYKLYNEAGLVYPPRVDIKKLKGAGGLSSYVLQSKDSKDVPLLQQKAETEAQAQAQAQAEDSKGKQLSAAEIEKALEADHEEEEEEAEANAIEEPAQTTVEEVELDEFQSGSTKSGTDTLIQPSRFSSPTSQLFSKFIFYIGREVPIDILEFVILACGGKVISEISLDDLKINDAKLYNSLDMDSITHQISDRNKLTHKLPGRTYIQPQWVFDSINQQQLLPVGEYAPGETLPPHLSPWGDAGGYDPHAKSELGGDGASNEAEAKAEEEEEEEEEEEVEVESGDEDKEEEEEEEEEDDDDDEDLQAQKELELEVSGKKFSELEEPTPKKQKKTKSAAKTKQTPEEEAKELAKIMMTNKQKKLYNKMQYGIEKKTSRNDALTKKRKQLEKKKQQLKKI